MPSLSAVLRTTAATILQRWWRRQRRGRRVTSAITIQRWWRDRQAVRALAWTLQVEAICAEFAELSAARPAAAVSVFSPEPFGIFHPATGVELPAVAPYDGTESVVVVIPPEDVASFRAAVTSVCPHVRLTFLSPPPNGLFRQHTKLRAALRAADRVVWSAHGCAGSEGIVLTPVHHKQFKFAA